MSKCLSRFFNIIKSLDKFRSGVVNFRMENDKESKSLSGGIASILFFIAAAIYVLTNLYSFLTRNNFNISSYRRIVKPEFILKEKETQFVFAFLKYGILPGNLTKIKDYFEFGLYIQTTNYTDENFYKPTLEPVPLVQCKEEVFKKYNDILNQSKHVNYLCPDFSNFQNIKLEGEYTRSYSTHLAFTVYPKNNVSASDIKQFISNHSLQLGAYISEPRTDYGNYSHPVLLDLSLYQVSLEYEGNKEFHCSMAELSFLSDNNWIYQNPYGNTYYYVSNIFNDYFPVRNNSDRVPLQTFRFLATNRCTKVYRVYQKLGELLGDFNGLLAFSFFIIEYIFSKRNEIGIQQKMMRIFFKHNYDNKFDTLIESVRSLKINELNDYFKNKNPEKYNFIDMNEFFQNQSSVNIISVNNSNNFNNTKNSNTTSSGKIIFKKHLSVHFQKEEIRKILKRNTCQLFFYKFCCLLIGNKTRHSYIDNFVENRLNFYFNCTNYIKRIEELELIKKITFSKEQRDLINFICVPNLDLEDYHKFNIDQNYIDLNQVFEAFRSMTNKSKLDYEEIKLLEIFRNNLEKLNL